MKLSDYKDEEAFEIWAELIEPATKIMANPKLKEMKGKPKILAIKEALKSNASECVEVLKIVNKKDESYSVNGVTVITSLIELLNEPGIDELFMSAGQTEGATSSGSPTENTEANEQ